MEDIKDILLNENKMTVSGSTRARCSECSWKGRLDACPLEEYQESWEYPVYTISVCPKCGGCVDI